MEEDKEQVKSFKDSGVVEELIEACDTLGWKNPSKIQAEAIPHALEGLLITYISLLNVFLFNMNHIDHFIFNFVGKDLIGLAQTGSGKTGAFAPPIIQALWEAPHPFFACVLSPTRYSFTYKWVNLSFDLSQTG